MNRVKKGILVLSAVGLVVLLVNMLGNRPTSVSYPRFPHDESQLMVPTTSQGLLEAKREPEYDAGGLLDAKREPEYDVDMKRNLDVKLWGTPGPVLEACWSENLPKRIGKTWGFVVVITSNGPHNHRAQIADAVVVATQLGASLIVPNVKEALKEPQSRFEDIYNVKHFIASLDGVVRVVGRLPNNIEKINKTITSIPLRVSREYIDEKVSPIFKQQGGLVVLGAFLPAMKGVKSDQEVEAIRCLVMHKALQFVTLVQKLGDRLISRMREAAPESSAKRFIAMDLQVDLLRHKTCNVTDAHKKRCLEPQEVGEFLKRVGYPSDTTIYLTQSRWERSLELLLQMFPNVHTKEYSMPFNEENQYLFSGKTQFEQAVDFYICSRSDVFVPTVPGLFYAHVAGERISVGLNHIIVPSLKGEPGSAMSQVTGVTSPYVEKKNHPVYLCYCEPPLGAPVNKSQGVVAPSTLESKLVAVAGKQALEKRKIPKDENGTVEEIKPITQMFLES